HNNSTLFLKAIKCFIILNIKLLKCQLKILTINKISKKKKFNIQKLQDYYIFFLKKIMFKYLFFIEKIILPFRYGSFFCNILYLFLWAPHIIYIQNLLCYCLFRKYCYEIQEDLILYNSNVY
ncbi:hypothetical protein RFI_00353, partial [Reticulomyxa filosa]